MSVQHNSPNTLENIAAELTVLAVDIARGKLRIGNRLVDIGLPLFIKTKQKITGNSAHFTFSFEAPLLDSDRETVAAADQKQIPAESPAGKHDKKLRLQGRAPEGKKIKKNISSLWRAVSRNLEQGQSPTPAEEQSLISAFESYTVFSEPAWQEEWLACFTTLQQALTCARGGDMPGALEYAAKVDALTKTCHKKHK
jgi:hypothetical protein